MYEVKFYHIQKCMVRSKKNVDVMQRALIKEVAVWLF